MPVKFTNNKQVVRDLQCEAIRKECASRLGYLNYFGLTSPDMKDAKDWNPLFSSFQVVERGEEGLEWRDQHDLLLSAAISGLSTKLSLLRGEMDQIAIDGYDVHGNAVNYPFDVVSLDYSGGLFYQAEAGLPRLKSIEEIIDRQSDFANKWLLFISLRVVGQSSGEVLKTLQNVRTELLRYGTDADKLHQALLNANLEEARLKVYVPFFINQIACRNRFRTSTLKTIMYTGNRGARMMNFRFALSPDPGTVAPRFPQERLVQVINSPILDIKKGKIAETTLGIPRLKKP